MNDLYDAALKAEAEGTINDWFVDFLMNSGGNEVLAGGLRADGAYHTGFINYELSKLKLLVGTDESFRYYEHPDEFNKKVDAMVKSIQDGWKPVPLIATDLWNDGLELNDGSHRAFALMRLGIKNYPTIFYFRSQEILDKFLADQIQKL